MKTLLATSLEKMFSILNGLKPVQETLRRGYIVPDNEEADALVEKLKERKDLLNWLFFEGEFNSSLSQQTVHTLLQSQSKNRHVRGAQIVENFSQKSLRFRFYFSIIAPVRLWDFYKTYRI